MKHVVADQFCMQTSKIGNTKMLLVYNHEEQENRKLFVSPNYVMLLPQNYIIVKVQWNYFKILISIVPKY